MKKLIKSALAACGAAAAFLAAPAHAIFGIGDIVLDPTNLVQNTSSAIAAVKNEVNTANSYINQVQQLIALSKSIQSVNGLSNLAAVQQELALYQQLRNVNTQLLGEMDRSRTLSESLHSQYGASNMDWQTFLTTKNDIYKVRANTMASQYAAIDANMLAIAQRRQNIVNELQASAGPTAAMQNVGAAVDALIGQNQQMITILRNQGADKVIEDDLRNASRDAAERELIEQQRALSNAARKYK